MFENQSLTWTSMISFGVLYLLKSNNVAGIDENSVTSFVLVAGQLITALGALWGRYRKGDITIVGRKRA